MKRYLTQFSLGMTALLWLSSAGHATVTSFSDNFQTGSGAALDSNWIQRYPSAPQATIVANPVTNGLDSSTQALSFTTLGSAGSLWSSTLIGFSGALHISFDYLGTCGNNNCGGYIGISSVNTQNDVSSPTSNQVQWIAGDSTYLYNTQLVDDGAWHHYDILFPSNIGSSVYLTAEQWVSGSGAAGTVFFDNISIQDVPEPASMTLLAVGAGALLVRRRRRSV